MRKTEDELIDMHKYCCVILKGVALFSDKTFPHFEAKWADAQSQGKPYELRFQMIDSLRVMSILYIFPCEDYKQQFLIDYPDVISLTKQIIAK